MSDVDRRKRVTGGYIRRWRTARGLSYEEVAEKLGVHPITVRNWEKAKSLKPLVRFAFDKAFLDGAADRYRQITRRTAQQRWHTFFRIDGCLREGEPHRIPHDCVSA